MFRGVGRKGAVGSPEVERRAKRWSLASGSACSAHITFTSRSRDRPLTYTTLLGCMMRQGFRLQMWENVALTGFVYKKKKEWNSLGFYTLPIKGVCMLSHFSPVLFFATPWTVALQAPLSMGFPRQEYWSGLPCPLPEDLPDPGSNLCLLGLLHWQVASLPLVHLGSPPTNSRSYFRCS